MESSLNIGNGKKIWMEKVAALPSCPLLEDGIKQFEIETAVIVIRTSARKEIQLPLTHPDSMSSNNVSSPAAKK